MPYAFKQFFWVLSIGINKYAAFKPGCISRAKNKKMFKKNFFILQRYEKKKVKWNEVKSESSS